MNTDELVLSDVHLEAPHPAAGASTCVTRFAYSLPRPHRAAASEAAAAGAPRQLQAEGSSACGVSSEPWPASSALDDDGDPVLARRPRRDRSLAIRHSLATTLPRVGEQLWPGACVLADWLLARREQLSGATVLELGAGVGLCSILAAAEAQPARVLLTDAARGALQLAASNVAANLPAAAAGGVCVRRLDWLSLFDVQPARLSDDELLEQLNGAGGPAAGASNAFAWRREDLAHLMRADLLLAADCVYDEALTDALMRSAANVMAAAREPAGARLVVALEKRWCFTLRDCDARAPAFEHWLSYVQRAGGPAAAGALFVGHRLDIASLPQSLAYDRSAELELWELRLRGA